MHSENRQANILYSCYGHKTNEGEQFIPNHVLSYIIAGRHEIFIGGKKHVFEEGDFRFFRRNQLSRYTKFPPPGGEFKSVSVIIDQDTLHNISAELNLQTKVPDLEINTVLLKPNQLLNNYINSLKPYMEGSSQLNKMLITIKVKEAIMILLETNPDLKDVLFDFSEPGKIDLEAYMNAHYRFNVDLSHFAYLTGRSLATFKRDFEKIFNTSPNRWLQQKRLNDAYYLIKEKGWRSSDVYLEVGFKDFSHFSYAFRKAYGITPSRIA